MKLPGKLFFLPFLAWISVSAQTRSRTIDWRTATAPELRNVLPARAPVVHERIETEVSSNTGIADDHGHYIAATVLITAGYAAHGKYSQFLVTQVPLLLDEHLMLAPGSYLIGWVRNAEGLDVHFYRAESGVELGSVEARPGARNMTVVSVRIWPPRESSGIQIGRFLIPYQPR